MSESQIIHAHDSEDTSQEQKIKDWYAGTIGRTLNKHYPWISWLVTIHVDPLLRGAVAAIKVPQISPEWGMTIDLTGMNLPTIEDNAKYAGGELLERFNVARQKKAIDDLQKLPRDIKGRVIGAEKGEL